MNNEKLTKAQERVMQWMSKGWQAHQANGAAVHINGHRVCNIDTMTALEQIGLVKKIDKTWIATAQGRLNAINCQKCGRAIGQVPGWLERVAVDKWECRPLCGYSLTSTSTLPPCELDKTGQQSVFDEIKY